jgi:hypothetical protein
MHLNRHLNTSKYMKTATTTRFHTVRSYLHLQLSFEHMVYTQARTPKLCQRGQKPQTLHTFPIFHLLHKLQMHLHCLSHELGNVKIAVNLGIYNSPKRQGVGALDLRAHFQTFRQFRAITSPLWILEEVRTSKDHRSSHAGTHNLCLLSVGKSWHLCAGCPDRALGLEQVTCTQRTGCQSSPICHSPSL